MKTYQKYLLSALALSAVAPIAWAQKEVIIRRVEADASPHRIIINKREGGGEKEQVTYLGVETAPAGRTLGAQLGLARDSGLVVTQVMEKSPAAGVLQPDDVLTKLDDQLLVNMPQLGVLVRAHKDGDEVKLVLVRGGKETSVKVKLGTREVPKGGPAFIFQHGGPGDMNWNQMLGNEGPGGLESLHGLPGMDPEHAREVLRMIGRERGNVMSGPGMHIITRSGKGSTIVDLPKSNISYSDDDGSIDIKVENDQRNLTVKNAKGDVTYQGSINTEEERAKLPPEVMKRLSRLEQDTFNVEVDSDFKPETVPLPPGPAKTKIHQQFGPERERPMDPALRSL
ncbi:MAG: PDZ domain-containing protein [Opitutae bacterium]